MALYLDKDLKKTAYGSECWEQLQFVCYWEVEEGGD